MDLETYTLSKSYTDKSLDGMGALKGAPCQIQDITNISGGKLVTFLWVDNNGTSHTSTMTVMDGEEGVGIASAVITDSHLIITYTDGTSVDAGTVDFGTGFSATATLSANAWVNNQQTVTFTGYTASMNGVVGVPSTMSGAQLLAYKNAGVYVVSQSGNQVTFGCDNVPSSDLPVGIYAGGGSGGEPTVIANPTLAGTEDDLTGLQVGNTKYKVPSGGSGSASWGSITGTLANQTDLATALGEKADTDDILDQSALVNHNVLKVTDGSGSNKSVSYSKADGVITIDGTSNSGAMDFNLGDNSGDGVLPNGTYKISMEIISGTYTGGNIQYTNNSSYVNLSAVTPTSVTLSGGTRSKINIPYGTVCNNLKIHVWANEGSTAYPYQKWGETGTVKLKSNIGIDRLDNHLANDTIHVTAEEKAKIDALPDATSAAFETEIAQTESDALSDINKKSLMLCVMADNHVCPTPYVNSGNTIGEESLRQYGTQLAHIKSLNLPIDAMVHLGDFVNTQWWWWAVSQNKVTDEDYQTYVSKYANRLKESGIENIFIVGGNHDGGLKITSGSGSEYSSYDAIYRTIGKPTDLHNVVRPDSKPYYYVDMEEYNLRLIFLYCDIDSNASEVKGFDYNQTVWLNNTLSSVPSGYNVLLFGHISFSIFETALKSSGSSKYNDVVGILSAFQNATTYTGTDAQTSADFTGNTKKILAYLCGHYHGDRIILPSYEHSVVPFAEVATASGGYVTSGVINTGDYYDAEDAPARSVGTITEDLFDIMTFNPIDKKLSFRRFGAGSDRVVDLSGIL